MDTYVNGPGESVTIIGGAMGPGASGPAPRIIKGGPVKDFKPVTQEEIWGDDEPAPSAPGTSARSGSSSNSGIVNAGGGRLTVTDSTVNGRSIDYLEMDEPGEVR